MSLPPLTERDLPKETRTVKVAGVDATVVDLTGMSSGGMPPFAGRGSMPPFEGRNQAPPAEQNSAALPFTYALPPGWEFDPRPRQMRRATFRVADGAQATEVAVATIGGDAGGFAANVDRWRGQMHLA